jgi:methylenetetrahydrofolate dehydrogenase (NADP+) / methenyltetrahydrofolate cyclohydrolase
MPQILDGTAVRNEILQGLKPRIDKLKRKPGLAVVLVGHNPASEVYVRSKIKTCGEIGIFSDKLTPPDSVTTEELLAVIADLNRRPDIDGILVQMPLPKQVDTRRVLEAVAPDKDADGFHPVNVGHLVAGRPAPRACTPAGIMELFKYYKIPIDGRRAVVLGRSDIVGKPMALMLLQQSATVTICHSATADLQSHTSRADVIVAAVGKRNVLTADMVKPGAVVIDVGMNRDDQGKLCGDVDFDGVREVAGWITPVPGGVGPMTRAMLLVNTLAAAEEAAGS